MKSHITVLGATGDLGGRIVDALLKQGTHVKAIVRPGTKQEKLDKVSYTGAQVSEVDTSSIDDLAKVLEGATCVVSAVAGLRDVIVDAQTVLLDAAILAGVPRFIPSDFSTDFTKLPLGENRNFDLRKEFHQRLDVAPIAATSIFNGAFGEILTYGIPLLNFKKGTIGYWEDPDWRIDFTSMDDTAAFTAAAAMDPHTPAALRIASVSITPRELVAFTRDVLGTPFELVDMGSLEGLSQYNAKERAAHPEGENELYPRWQQSQYMYSMFSVRHEALDNDRYPNLKWATLGDILASRIPSVVEPHK